MKYFTFWASQMVLVVERRACNPWVGKTPGGGHGTHSSILAWGIPRTEEPGGYIHGVAEANMTEAT